MLRGGGAAQLGTSRILGPGSSLPLMIQCLPPRPALKATTEQSIFPMCMLHAPYKVHAISAQSLSPFFIPNLRQPCFPPPVNLLSRSLLYSVTFVAFLGPYHQDTFSP